MINRVVLVGRITEDPTLKKTGAGTSVVSFTLACNRNHSKEGEQQTDFISCVAWRQSADFMANYVKKGYLLGVEGRIQTRNYKDQSNRTIYVTEIVADSVQILAHKHDNNQTKANTPPQQQSASQFNYGGYDAPFKLDDSDSSF